MGVEVNLFLPTRTMAPYQGLETIMSTAELLKHRDDISISMIETVQ